MTIEDLKIIAKGFLGSMTFGAYHIYTTTHLINELNKNNQLKIDELMKKIEKIENRRFQE